MTLIAFLTLKKGADTAFAPSFARDPFPRDERRLVPDMLVMTTLEFCAPIILIILVESYDLFSHLH
jgi:hypothetical protein